MTKLQTIATQLRDPVADLVPVGTVGCRSNTAAAHRMRHFMQDAPDSVRGTPDTLAGVPVDLKELIDAGRD
jgi:hypothetical protein